MNRGDLVADFELPDQYGRLNKLSTLLHDGPVVLFFYPVASSSGCTREACQFRDLGDAFAEAGAHRIGISTDSVTDQKRFSDTHGFDYPLLSDSDGSVARQFGVKRRIKALPVKRKTFIIGMDSRILDVISSEFNMQVHAQKALQILASGDRAA